MRTWNEAQDSRPWACLAGWSIQPFLLFQEQEDPNKLATSWPDYYIDRINSMAAVSLRLSCPGPTRKGCGGWGWPSCSPAAHIRGSAASQLFPRLYHDPSLPCVTL